MESHFREITKEQINKCTDTYTTNQYGRAYFKCKLMLDDVYITTVVCDTTDNKVIELCESQGDRVIGTANSRKQFVNVIYEMINKCSG